MLRALNRLVLIASSIAVLVCFWNRNEIPGTIALHSVLESEPRQRRIDQQPFFVAHNGTEYRVEPQYDYELYGMVVSYRQHDGKSFMHRMSNDHLNMADICVVWSDNASSPHLRELEFWNGIFTCNVSTTDADAWSAFRMNQLSNNHLISADPLIRDRVGDVRIGDQIRIEGWLASYGAIVDGKQNGLRGTSTTREDTGDGACETIYVKEFEIIEPAFSSWRFGLGLASFLLVASLVLHFALPYRPYRA